MLISLDMVATFELIQNSLTFPWHFPDNLFYFSRLKKYLHVIVIKGNHTTYSGFLKGNSLTVIISKPWVYICQTDIYINKTQVDPLLYNGSFHVKKCHNKIPWQFPDMGQMTKIPWLFFKIPWLFHDLEKILFFPDISLLEILVKGGLVVPW